MAEALENPAMTADLTVVEVATPIAAITLIPVMTVAMLTAEIPGRIAEMLAPMAIRAQEIPGAMAVAVEVVGVVEAAAEAGSYCT